MYTSAVHIKCKYIHVVNALLLNSFPNKYLSRYNSDSLDYQWEPPRIQSRDLTTPLPLTIDINWKLATINVKPMGMVLKLFIKTGNGYSVPVNSSEFLYQLMYTN